MIRLHRIDLLTTLVITLLGVFQGQVTVFYIIYLFWFQELVRTIVDFLNLFWHKKTIKEKLGFVQVSFGSFFILFIYFVFIVVLFGLMLNWHEEQLLGNNLRVLMFRNWYFNANILLFLVEYCFFRVKTDPVGPQLQIFNRRHIILHISIILGAMIQLAILPRLSMHQSHWTSVLTVMPFLLLKLFIDSTPAKAVRVAS